MTALTGLRMLCRKACLTKSRSSLDGRRVLVSLTGTSRVTRVASDWPRFRKLAATTLGRKWPRTEWVRDRGGNGGGGDLSSSGRSSGQIGRLIFLMLERRDVDVDTVPSVVSSRRSEEWTGLKSEPPFPSSCTMVGPYKLTRWSLKTNKI